MLTVGDRVERGDGPTLERADLLVHVGQHIAGHHQLAQVQPPARAAGGLPRQDAAGRARAQRAGRSPVARRAPAPVPGAGPVFRAACGRRLPQHTANLYFRTSGKITWDETESLANGKRPGLFLFSDMEKFTPPDGYTFSVPMAVGDGEIQRVRFYTLKLPAARFPAVGERLATFFQLAPSHDDEETTLSPGLSALTQRTTSRPSAATTGVWWLS